MKDQLKICICGIQGYTGQELFKLVMQHPFLQLTSIMARKTKEQLFIEIPFIKEHKIPIYSLDSFNDHNIQVDVLLLATPPEVSIEIVSLLKNSTIKIIDLSGAFRLPLDELKQWYNIEHPIPELLNRAQYGLSPWGLENKIQHCNNQYILANPGCYATCALMPLIPLIKHHIIKNDNIIIDAKSGTSGAGKKANSNLMLGEISENFFPYKVGRHQHIPEINNAVTKFTKKSCDVTFITQMLPIFRGISMSIYVNAEPNFKSDKEISLAINSSYKIAYKNYPLVNFGEVGNDDSETNKELLSLKYVVKTPKIHIAYFINKGKVIIFACIDNLLKGAASQAIENINAIYNLPLETGLLMKEEIK